MDDIERAQDYQAREIKHALARRRRLSGEAALVCADCGEPIPEQRRLACPGCMLCIECARDAEAEAARGR